MCLIEKGKPGTFPIHNLYLNTQWRMCSFGQYYVYATTYFLYGLIDGHVNPAGSAGRFSKLSGIIYSSRESDTSTILYAEMLFNRLFGQTSGISGFLWFLRTTFRNVQTTEIIVVNVHRVYTITKYPMRA